MGLMWVGEKYYPTADHFSREAINQGISKRIAQIPRDFVVGKTWIALAHPAAITKVVGSGIISMPGIFTVFLPTAIEYVVTGKETPDQLERLEKRGITLIEVIPQEVAAPQINLGL